MNERLKFIYKTLQNSLIDDDKRIRLQFLCLYVMFSVLALVMTFINAVTAMFELMYVTMAFGILNVFNLLLSIKPTKVEKITRIIFAVECLIMFTYFIILGEPKGFSAIWCALIPAFSLLLYKKGYGSLISLFQFIIMAILFWTKLGDKILQYEYDSAFTLRFPILYLAFYLVAFLFETIRETTQKQLVLSRESYKQLSYTDRLTGLGSETLYYRTVDNIEKHSVVFEEYALVVIDVNGVKATNDKYGHRFGCNLIVTTGRILPTVFPNSHIFRIGGDEFLVLAIGDDYRNIDERIRNFDNKLEYTTIEYDKHELILSVARGYSKYVRGDKYSTVFQRADEKMYENKRKIKQLYDIAIR